MSENIFNLYNLIFNYGGTNVPMIIDEEKNIWFSAVNVARLLKYKDENHAITRNTEKEDRKLFIELEHNLEQKPPNSQPNEIYINETGFYGLVFSTTKKVAKD